MIPHILRTALFGTEKQSLDTQTLPNALQASLARIATQEAETVLLQAITLSHFYEESGRKPPIFEGNQNPEIIVEEQAEAPEVYQQLYPSIKELPPFARFACMYAWLDGFVRLGAIPSPDNTITLLSDFTNYPQHIQAKIALCLGKKGRMLLPFYSDFQAEETQPDAQIWEEGKLKERRLVFQKLRQQNPAEAIALLEKTWQTETLPEKKAFLEEIAKTLVSSDIAFLENLWLMFAFKSQEKKAHKEIRWLLTGLLMRFTTSNVYQQLTNELKTYVQAEKSKGVLGWVGKTELSFALPTSDDAFFNAQSMEERWGLLTPKDYDNLPSAHTYWLSNLLEIIPMNFWENVLQKNTEEVVKYWQQDLYCHSIDRKKYPFLQKALIQNALHFGNQHLASVLCQQKDWVNFASVLPLLSQAEREKLILQHKVHTDAFILNTCFEGTQEIWSIHFSKEIIKACHELIFKRSGYISEALIALLSAHLHPSSIAFLESLDTSIGQHQHLRLHWQQRIVDTLVMNSAIREKIATLTQ